MTCRGFIQLLLKVINVLFTFVGLAMIGYGIYMVIIYENSSASPPPPPPPSPPPPSLSPSPSPSPSPTPSPSPSPSPSSSPPPPPPPPPPPSPPPPSSPPPPPPASPPPPDESFLKYGLPSLDEEQEWAGGSTGVLHMRRVLLQKSLTLKLSPVSSVWSSIPTAWFIYVFIGVGVVITLITCSGCIAASTTNGCCLSCYSFFVGLVIVLELGIAAFIFFYNDWQDVIPEDSTGELESIEDFIADKFYILKWVALGIIILQAFALFLAVILRALVSNARADYDSDDEYVALRNSRQPLPNRQAGAGSSTNVAGSENQPPRTDAWSTRMREKYGLDTKEFSYKPTESKKTPPSAGEEKSCCSVM